MLIIIFSVSLIDLLYSLYSLSQPTIAGLLRPFILATCMASVRSNASTFFYDLKDASVILLSIFIFVFVYSAFGHYLFQYSVEGYMYFFTVTDSYWNMLILLTTANFPDVMLPSYNASFFWSLYFVTFLVLGLYMLLNLLLAQVFNSFRNRLVEQGVKYLEKMEKHLNMFYNRFDKDEKNYLEPEQLQAFCNELLDLDIAESQTDREEYEELV